MISLGLGILVLVLHRRRLVPPDEGRKVAGLKETALVA